MSYLPCRNENCKSYGHPHPNCKCYGGNMAEGGEVGHYCDEQKPHDLDCEYYAEGGDVEPTWENSTPAEETPTWDNSTPVERSSFQTLKDMVVPQSHPDAEPTWENSASKYETPGQQIGTALEGAAQGLAGPVATAAELGLSKLGVPGLSAEDIKGRAEANPLIHGGAEAAGLAAGFIPAAAPFTFAGNVAKAAKFFQAAEEAKVAAKLGSSAIQSAIQAGAFQAGDEATKSMLGQGDPNVPVSAAIADAGANILFSGVLGGGIGLGTGFASNKLSQLADSKMGSRIHSFLMGVGERATGKPAAEIDPLVGFGKEAAEASIERIDKSYKNGIKWFDSNIGNMALYGATSYKVGSDVASSLEHGDPTEAIERAARDVLVGGGIKLGLKKISPIVGAAILKSVGTGETTPTKILQAIDYANKVNSGAQKMTRGVDALFTTGAQQAFSSSDMSKRKEKLDKFIGEGGVDQQIQQSLYGDHEPAQAFAKGGEVRHQEPSQAIDHHDAIADHYPEQNVLLNTAKGRVSNYLKNLRPQANQPKLAFDHEPDQRVQKKSYDKALDIAVQPLSVLDKIKKGTIEAEHVQHLKNLYPELDSAMQKKLTERITKDQMAGKKPPYHVRQGLSMLMGTPLSGEMTPQNIQAAQATFQMKSPQGQQSPTKNKKNTSNLTKADDSFMTGNQARTARQQKQ